MRTLAFCVAVVGFSGILASGCGGSPPSAPPLTGNECRQEAAGTGTCLTALYSVFIDPAAMTVEAVPLRGPLFEANVTRFLQPPISPTNLLSISVKSGTDFTKGHVVIDVTVRHPFPGTKFAGFDVKGIVMGEAGTACKWDPALVYADSSGVRLLNADGWTRWWNQQEFLSYGTIFGYTEGSLANHGFDSVTTLNPYKYFCDELDADDSVWEVTENGRGFFSSESPGINTRRYDLQFPLSTPQKFRFKYAVTANWVEPSAGASEPWTQDDYPLSANQPEAFRLSVADAGSDAFFENATTYGGDLNLVLRISDWQLMPGGNPLDEISAVYVESPTLFPGTLNVLDPSLVTSGPDPMTVNLSVTISDVTPSATTGQLLIFHVTSTHPSTYEPQIPGISGFVWPESAQLASHIIWQAPISPVGPPQNQPPVADASASEPLSGNAPLSVHLDPSLSYDPDGSLVLYEWDFDNDGSFDASTAGPDVVDHVFPDPGTFYVNLRVTDNGGLSDELDAPLMIEVMPPLASDWCQLQDATEHVGEVTEPVTLHPPLKELWHAKLSTTSNLWIEGSPIVGEGFVMVLYSGGPSNWAECFTLETGEAKWKVNISPGGMTSYIGTQTGAYGDGRFYVPGDKIRALDPSTGAVLWQYAADPFETERHGLVFRDGKVMVHLGGLIHVLDAATGALVKSVSVGAGWANFQPFTLRGDTAYVQHYGSLAAFNINSGAMIWSFPVDPPIFGIDSSVRCAPTAPGDGRVYFGCYNGYYYALNEQNGTLAWKTPMNGGTQRSFDTAAVAGGKLYYGEGTGNGVTVSRFVCLDASNGQEVWQYTPAGASVTDGWSTCSPIVVNGVVYAGHTSGLFAAFDAQTGEMLWSFKAAKSAATDPVAVGDRLLVLSDDATLWCFVNE